MCADDQPSAATMTIDEQQLEALILARTAMLEYDLRAARHAQQQAAALWKAAAAVFTMYQNAELMIARFVTAGAIVLWTDSAHAAFEALGEALAGEQAEPRTASDPGSVTACLGAKASAADSIAQEGDTAGAKGTSATWTLTSGTSSSG